MTEKQCKVILLGESAVGKTSIISRYTENKFSTEQESTVGANFASKSVKANNGQICQLIIWDTAGAEKFRAVNKFFYREAEIAILVYDITNKESFEEIKNYWLDEVKKNGPAKISKL